MFDFANSSYTTVILTVCYAVVFPRLIVGDGPDYRTGNLLWSVALSGANLLVVLTLPVLGAMMDQLGHRKRFLAGSTALTVVATAALALAGPGDVALAVVLVVLSAYGFALGESFIASFLPDLGPPDSLGRISGMAWGLGYVGGLLSTAIVLFGLGPAELDNMARQRWIGPITAAWFALASVPTFLWLRDRARPKGEADLAGAARAGLRQLVATTRQLAHYRDLAVFLCSYLFAMAGLSIVISFAFIYGDQVIGWSAGTQAAMFVITQITATVGALGFGWLQPRLGDKRTYALTLVVWLLSVVLIWGTGRVAQTARMLTGAPLADEQVFLGVGAMAGLCLGATQSSSRTLIALFAPADKVGEFFGLWGVFGKLAAVVGLLSLGALQAWVGLKTGVLVTGVFFVSALAVLTGVDAERGRAAAGRTS
jgi:UMF1 family MFS transporter